MADKITVPTLGESLTEATVAKWLKKVGDSVQEDEEIVSLETDKVSIDVTAPKSGILSEIIAKDGATVEVGAHLGSIDTSVPSTKKKDEQQDKKETKVVETKKEENIPEKKIDNHKQAHSDLSAAMLAKPSSANKSPNIRLTRSSVSKPSSANKSPKATTD
jgi:2-oxoglutarate dehydrogenase E2 component (dihydrolipoamide succinyltransferase)